MYHVLKLEGMRFGRLVVTRREVNKINNRALFLCKCDCGNEKIIRSDALQSGVSTSCGCYHKEMLLKANTTHGMSRSGIYTAWEGMKARCNNMYSDHYKDYGGRGIKLCKRWHKFENFYSDMGERPCGMTIERKDNNGNYEPGNCRWATQKEQKNNTRRTRFYEFNSQSKTLMQWSESTGMSISTLRHRVLNLGWDIEKALITPLIRTRPSSYGLHNTQLRAASE